MTTLDEAAQSHETVYLLTISVTEWRGVHLQSIAIFVNHDTAIAITLGKERCE
jgi:hypothetical protein